MSGDSSVYVASVMDEKNMRREHPLVLEDIPDGGSSVGEIQWRNTLRRFLLLANKDKIERRKAARTMAFKNFDELVGVVRTKDVHRHEKQKTSQSSDLGRQSKMPFPATGTTFDLASSPTILTRPSTPHRVCRAREETIDMELLRLSAELSLLDTDTKSKSKSKSKWASIKAGESTFSAEPSALPVTPTRRLAEPSSPSIRAPIPRPLAPSRTRVHDDLFVSAEPTSPVEELQSRAQCKSDLLRSMVPAPVLSPSTPPAPIPSSIRAVKASTSTDGAPAPTAFPQVPSPATHSSLDRIDVPTFERAGPRLFPSTDASTSTHRAPVPTEVPRPASPADEPPWDAAVDLPPTPSKQAYASSHVERRRRQTHVHPRLPLPRTSRYSPRPFNALTRHERERIELVVHRRMRRHEKAPPAVRARSVGFCAEAMRRVAERRVPLRPILAESWTSLDKLLRQAPRAIAPVAVTYPQTQLMLEDDPMTMYEDQVVMDAPAAMTAEVLCSYENARWGLPPAHSLSPAPSAPAADPIADLASDQKINGEHLAVQAEWEQAPAFCMPLTPSISASQLIPILGASISDFDEPMDVPYSSTAPELSSEELLKANAEAIAELCPAEPTCDVLNEAILVQQSGEVLLLEEEHPQAVPGADAHGPCDAVDEDNPFEQLVETRLLEQETCLAESDAAASDTVDEDAIFQQLGEVRLLEEEPCQVVPGAGVNRPSYVVDEDTLFRLSDGTCLLDEEPGRAELGVDAYGPTAESHNVAASVMAFDTLAQACRLLEELNACGSEFFAEMPAAKQHLPEITDDVQSEFQIWHYDGAEWNDGQHNIVTGASAAIAHYDSTAASDRQEQQLESGAISAAISPDVDDFLAAALEDETTEKSEAQSTSMQAQLSVAASQQTPEEALAPIDGDLSSLIAWSLIPLTSADFYFPLSGVPDSEEGGERAYAPLATAGALFPDINDSVDRAAAVAFTGDLSFCPALPTALPDDDSGFQPAVATEADAATPAACDEPLHPTLPSSALSPTPDVQAELVISQSCTPRDVVKAVDGLDNSFRNRNLDVSSRPPLRVSQARRVSKRIPASSGKNGEWRRSPDVGTQFKRRRPYVLSPVQVPDDLTIQPSAVPLRTEGMAPDVKYRSDEEEGAPTRSTDPVPGASTHEKGDGDGNSQNDTDDSKSSPCSTVDDSQEGTGDANGDGTSDSDTDGSEVFPCYMFDDSHPPTAPDVAASPTAMQGVLSFVGRIAGLVLHETFQALLGDWW